MRTLLPCILTFSLLTFSCESEEAKKSRLERKEQLRKEQQAQLEEARVKKQAILEFGANSLRTGETPYAYCFGANGGCYGQECSQIKVRTPSNSDVLVTIKSDNIVIRHAYIKAGNTYTFDIPNGTYQTFFYYGKGWFPDKVIKQTTCGLLKGGFLQDEYIGKDDPQVLNNDILSYELILQQNGNFSTRQSSSTEAF